MDNRLKFLYCSITELWGHRGEHKPGMEKTGASEVGDELANPLHQSEDVMRTEISREVCEPCCQEKPLLFVLYPYRKPTQVDEERILRPTGEALLRNSAK